MAQAEMEEQLHIDNKVLSTQCGYNIVNNIQDVIICMYFMTLDETIIETKDFFDLCVVVNLDDWKFHLKRASQYFPQYIKKNGKLKKNAVPGKVVASIAFPSTFSYNCYGVEIENGIMIKGVLDKKTLGSKRNSIIHKVAIEYGSPRASKLAGDFGWISNHWSCIHGYTFGIMDCMTTKKKDVKKTIKEAQEKVKYIMATNKGKREKEALIVETLNNVASIGQKLAKEGMVGGKNNAMAVATITGAKGNYHNLMCISGALGLHTVKGKRMEPELCEGTRTLPCFRRNDDRLNANCFVERNYLQGLGPADMIWSSWATRDGLINTAVTTRSSGYGHRRFEKKMENLRTYNDGTVRDCNGKIIDYCYGEYGFDGTKVFYVEGIPFFCDVESIAKMCNSRYIQEGGDSNVEMLTLDNVDSIMKHFKFFKPSVETHASISQKERVRYVLEKGLKKSKIYKDKSVISDFIKTLIKMFNKALVSPGEMVGGKASNALGEDGTQGALNAFHSAGRSTKTTTTGLPRLMEIIDLTKEPKITSCSFKYNDKRLINGDEKQQLERVCELRKKFEYKELKDLADITLEKMSDDEITNDYERLLGIHKIHDVPLWVSIYCKLMELDQPEMDAFAIRVTMKKEMMYKYRLSLHEIVECLESTQYIAIPSPPSEMCIIIYPNFDNIPKNMVKKLDTGDDGWKYYYARDIIMETIKETHITGIHGIQEIFHAGDNKIDVQGNNFAELMKCSKVIFSTLETDVIKEVYTNLGIDAVYIFICQELKKVFTKEISPCNIMLLARAMTRDGCLTNVTRHGINDDVGVMTKMMNETAMEIIENGSLWGSHDGMESAASAYLLGSLGKFGTSNPSFELLV